MNLAKKLSQSLLHYTNRTVAPKNESRTSRITHNLLQFTENLGNHITGIVQDLDNFESEIDVPETDETLYKKEPSPPRRDEK